MSQSVRWTPDRMTELEEAVRMRRRVALTRRGTEYVIVAEALVVRRRAEVLVGRVPMTGETLEFRLGELDHFQVVAS